MLFAFGFIYYANTLSLSNTIECLNLRMLSNLTVIVVVARTKDMGLQLEENGI